MTEDVIFTCIIKIDNSLNKYLLTAYYIPGPVWGAETLAVNKVYGIPVLRQLADKSKTNINKSTRKCQLVISTMLRVKIG